VDLLTYQTFEPLTDIQKKQYMAELGLEVILGNYNKEILKHVNFCVKCRDEGLICHKNIELRVKRDRVFQLMREEERELSYHDWQ